MLVYYYCIIIIVCGCIIIVYIIIVGRCVNDFILSIAYSCEGPIKAWFGSEFMADKYCVSVHFAFVFIHISCFFLHFSSCYNTVAAAWSPYFLFLFFFIKSA